MPAPNDQVVGIHFFFFLEKFSFGKGNKDPEHAIRFVHDGKTQELVARNDEGNRSQGMIG